MHGQVSQFSCSGNRNGNTYIEINFKISVIFMWICLLELNLVNFVPLEYFILLWVVHDK